MFMNYIIKNIILKHGSEISKLNNPNRIIIHNIGNIPTKI